MPKLDELRNHFGGVKKIPRKKRHPPVDMKAGAAKVLKKKKIYYTISTDGEDAVLHFGKLDGNRVSDIADEDPSYLRWMLKEQDGKLKTIMDSDLVSVVEYQLMRHK